VEKEIATLLKFSGHFQHTSINLAANYHLYFSYTSTDNRAVLGFVVHYLIIAAFDFFT